MLKALVISSLLLWVVVIVLGVCMIAVSRQIGLFIRTASTHMFPAKSGPDKGTNLNSLFSIIPELRNSELKYYVIIVVSTGCSMCVDLAQGLAALKERINTSYLYSVVLGEQDSIVTRSMLRLEIPIGFENEDVFARQYLLRELPIVFVLDHEFSVVDKFVGSVTTVLNLCTDIQKYLTA